MSDRYPPEFRARIVELYLRGERSAKDLGREFGVSPTTVSNWARKARTDEGVDPGSGAVSDREEIVRLRRLLERREEELEILGKVLAFFARRADPQ